jgi:hypothetical protein
MIDLWQPAVIDQEEGAVIIRQAQMLRVFKLLKVCLGNGISRFSHGDGHRLIVQHL